MNDNAILKVFNNILTNNQGHNINNISCNPETTQNSQELYGSHKGGC